jgi:putative intracellular protease/amidase
VTTVLIALTGAAEWTMKDGSALPAGFWAEELVEPYQILTAAGVDVVLATPGGVAAPLQDYSLDESMTGSAERTADLRAALAGLAAPVATVCHGTIGLLSARSGGAWLFAGYQMTGYTDEEESQGGPGDAAPFTLESRLRAEGANFTAGAPWREFTATDRNLITGQNPGSAAAVARQLVIALGR